MSLINIITFLLIFYIITSLIWCYYPTFFLATNYKVDSNLSLKDIKEPTIIVYPHKQGSSSFLEIIMVCKETLFSERKCNIISSIENKKTLHSVNNFFKNYPLFTPYNILYITKNTVDKSIKCLQRGENIIIFINKNTTSSGLYNIFKEKKYPIIFGDINLKKHYNKMFSQSSIIYERLDPEIEKNIESSEELMDIVNKKFHNDDLSKT